MYKLRILFITKNVLLDIEDTYHVQIFWYFFNKKTCTFVSQYWHIFNFLEEVSKSGFLCTGMNLEIISCWLVRVSCHVNWACGYFLKRVVGKNQVFILISNLHSITLIGCGGEL